MSSRNVGKVRNNQEEGSSLSSTSRRKPEITYMPAGVRVELRLLFRLWPGMKRTLLRAHCSPSY